MLAMATAEVAVSELREGLPPLKKAAPPLSMALQRIAAAKAATSANGGAKQRQSCRLLKIVAAWNIVGDDGGVFIKSEAFRVQMAPFDKITIDFCRSRRRLHDSDLILTKNPNI